MIVCILTAGRGTRMYQPNMNKALLPVGKKAIITRIIEKFPEKTEFIVAVGHLKEQVKSYLTLAHPKTKFTFVDVDKYEGKGSGPGYSLSCCEKHLRRAFYFITCDTLWDEDLPDCKQNWMAGKPIPSEISERFCNMVCQDGRVRNLYDKVKVIGSPIAWAGFSFVKSYDIFWESLNNSDAEINGEIQLSNGFSGLVQRAKTVKYIEMNDWVDVGTLDNYHNYCRKFEEYDFGKIDESIYSVGDRIVKFYADPLIAENRIRRAAEKPHLFPKIIATAKNFYAYEFKPGKTVYEMGFHHVPSLLKDMKDRLWEYRPQYNPDIQAACMYFYKTKTLYRIGLFKKSCPDIKDDLPINGRDCGKLDEILADAPWDLLANGKPYFIHGDLQFDNIIFDGKKFTLIDWRQDFGERIEFGDIYYDMAKLLGGAIINYDLVKKNMIFVEENSDGIWIDFATRSKSKLAQEQILSFADDMGLNVNKIKILTALVFINMAALHYPLFNKLLYYYGKSMLKEHLKG